MTAALPLPTWLQTLSQAVPSSELSAALLAHQAQYRQAFLEHGLPTRKHERWKYADLQFLSTKAWVAAKPVFNAEHVQAVIAQRRLKHTDSVLLVCVNGYFMPDLCDLIRLPANVRLCSRSDAFRDFAADMTTAVIDAQRYPFACLNALMSTDGLFLALPDQCKLSVPVHLLSIVTESHDVMLSPHHHVIVGEQSQLTLLEEYVSLTSHAYWMNTAATIVLQREARCGHYKIQQESELATHLSHTFVEQRQDSYFNATQCSTGGAFARDELIVQLRESGAACDTAGFYRTQRDHQYLDHHIDINHLAPDTQSDMLYKGIADQRSRAVFNGRVYVQKDAQKINAHQTNHHLLLSSAAEVYAKPELEIYADDVKCKHGASTGQLDEEALFYLRSRGLTYQEAFNVLLHAFGDAVLARFPSQGMKERAQELMYL